MGDNDGVVMDGMVRGLRSGRLRGIEGELEVMGKVMGRIRGVRGDGNG